MAVTPAKPSVKINRNALLCALLIFISPSCKTETRKIYQSNCDDGIAFKHVSFSKLVDSINKFDQQYVEVDGVYKEGTEESALVNDSLFVDHSSQHAIWINFSQDCPLYLEGTHQGLFEFNDGQFTQINNQRITIRGKIDVKHKGHLGSYKASLDRISLVKL